MSNEKNDSESKDLDEMLPVYYRRLFPFRLFYKWLSYGNIDSREFSNREFSFTLKKDIYVRYLSFNTLSEMEESITSKNPYKIDLGAIFSFPPGSHRQVINQIEPVARELVFDVDLTDYDDVRRCCQGAEVCKKCWKFMSIACKILDSALRHDFGFYHLLWVFSGRRGIHCWVCDDTAKALSGPERGAIADYLQLISSSNDPSKKKVDFSNDEVLHFSIRRAVEIIDSQFFDVCIQGQGLLQKPEYAKKLLALIPEEKLRKRIVEEMRSCSTDEEKWQVFQRELKNKSIEGFNERQWLLEELMIEYAYPRLDINVTKGLNHLLKSPFCVHPDTGKICVPFSPDNVDEFDPTTVPTIVDLMQEVADYDTKLEENATDEELQKIRTVDYGKTSLNKSIEVFKEFIGKLENGWEMKRLRHNVLMPF